MPLGAKAAAAAKPVVIVQSSGFHLVSFLLGILAALVCVACAVQTDADPYLFDAPLGECVRDSAHRNKKLCAKDC